MQQLAVVSCACPNLGRHAARQAPDYGANVHQWLATLYFSKGMAVEKCNWEISLIRIQFVSKRCWTDVLLVPSSAEQSRRVVGSSILAAARCTEYTPC